MKIFLSSFKNIILSNYLANAFYYNKLIGLPCLFSLFIGRLIEKQKNSQSENINVNGWISDLFYLSKWRNVKWLKLNVNNMEINKKFICLENTFLNIIGSLIIIRLD